MIQEEQKKERSIWIIVAQEQRQTDKVKSLMSKESVAERET